MKIILNEKKINLSDRKIGNLILYSYQNEAVQTILDNHKGIFVISAGTGMGKTAISVVSTILGNWKKTILIYPTNELIKNQKQSIMSITKLIEEHNIDVEEVYQYSIKQLMEDTEYLHSKSGTLIDILRGKMNSKARFILSNPDTLHLILQLKYGSRKYKTRSPAQVLNQLTDYRMLVIDEFHYYKDRMLNNLLIDLTFAVSIGIFDKIVLMTATPDPTIYKYLERIANIIAKDNNELPLFFIQQETESELKSNSKTVTYPTEIELKIGGWNNVKAITDMIFSLKNEIIKKQSKNVLPLCVILDSVIQARSISEIIKNNFNISEIHGLVPQPLRSIDKNTHVIIGTNAIEVGIDFDTERLIFEAKETASFLQRLGRAARKRPAKVWAFIPEYVYNFLSKKIDLNKTYDKFSFAEIIQEAFIEKNQKYIGSEYAKLEVVKVINTLFSIRKEKVISDISLREIIVRNIEQVFQTSQEKINEICDKYSRLRIEKEERFVMFRSGEPQILVHDLSAQKNGFFPYYFSPISRIIERANKLINIKRGQKVIAEIYSKISDYKEKEQKDALNLILMELKRKEKSQEPILMPTIYGYSNKKRVCRFIYVDPISQIKATVDENEQFLGQNFLQLYTDTQGFSELGILFDKKLFSIIPFKYTGNLDWRISRFVAESVSNHRKGSLFFDADCLVALAYMENEKKMKAEG